MGIINNFYGAETGGLEETVTAGANLSAVTTDPPPGGRYYYLIDAIGSLNLETMSLVPDAGGGVIVGFRAYLGAPGGIGNYNWRLTSLSGLRSFDLRYTSTTENFEFRDASATVHHSIPELEFADRWRYVEIYAERVASGDFMAWVDNVLVMNVSTASTSRADYERFSMQQENSNPGTGIRLDDFYVMTNALPGDRLGPVRVMGHQPDATTSDANIGGDFTASDWSDISTTPADANEATLENPGSNNGKIVAGWCDGATSGGQGRGLVGQELDDNRAPLERRGAVYAKAIANIKRTNGAGSNFAFGGYDKVTDNHSLSDLPIKTIELTTSYALFQQMTRPGLRWTQISSIPSGSGPQIAYNSATNRIIAAAYSLNGCYISDDGGYHWRFVSESGMNGNFIAYNATQEVWAICSGVDSSNDNCWTSTDDGETWSANSMGFVSAGTNVQTLAHGNGWFVATQSRTGFTEIRRSQDGVTWSATTGYASGTKLVTGGQSEAVPGAAGNWVVAYASASSAIYRSTDNGSTWAAATTQPNMSTANTSGLYYNPETAQYYFGDNSGANDISYSDDEGAVWSMGSYGISTRAGASFMGSGVFHWTNAFILHLGSIGDFIEAQNAATEKTNSDSFRFRERSDLVTLAYGAGPAEGVLIPADGGAVYRSEWGLPSIPALAFFCGDGGRDLICNAAWIMTLQQEADPIRAAGRPQILRSNATRNLRM